MRKPWGEHLGEVPGTNARYLGGNLGKKTPSKSTGSNQKGKIRGGVNKCLPGKGL